MNGSRSTFMFGYNFNMTEMTAQAIRRKLNARHPPAAFIRVEAQWGRGGQEAPDNTRVGSFTVLQGARLRSPTSSLTSEISELGRNRASVRILHVSVCSSVL